MGPIAARMALSAVDCLADIVAIEALLAAQGLDLRQRGLAWDSGGNRVDAAPGQPPERILELHARVRAVVPFRDDDDVLHPVLDAVGRLVRAGGLKGPPGPW
jgi:histidine ammonia-lyase